ncbi:hypothetical protein RSOLAG22IIIB_00961 [Rhizoctonia solani]|uniref:DinB-like domain-containing protein n=1 Tax=Rhizoctonia solani TaxID=456999 RepID=A0A0K6G190_9AGAM|nr:hypothetical protein RSOLAG22IIIB_00961 [Rhizoctonia solani]
MAPTATTHTESIVVSNKTTEPQDHSVVVEQLTDVARHVMGQAIDLLQNTLTDDKQLTYQSKYIPGSTIGKHLRHARDHYVLLSKAVLDVTSTGPSNGQAPAALSYDARSRDTPMETSITAGIEAFQEAIKQLESISKYAPEDLPIVLTADTGPYQQTLNTTYGRELWFGSLHAIHHWSMVRVIAGELGLELDANFGVAPSTINYHKNGSKSKI